MFRNMNPVDNADLARAALLIDVIRTPPHGLDKVFGATLSTKNIKFFSYSE